MMNVRSLYSSAPARYEAAQAMSERGPAQERSGLRKVTDSVVLSQRARAALDEMRSRPEIDLSIKSKMHPEQLGARRTYEVVGRINGGYYREPHVLRHVASHVSGALAYGP